MNYRGIRFVSKIHNPIRNISLFIFLNFKLYTSCCSCRLRNIYQHLLTCIFTFCRLSCSCHLMKRRKRMMRMMRMMSFRSYSFRLMNWSFPNCSFCFPKSTMTRCFCFPKSMRNRCCCVKEQSTAPVMMTTLRVCMPG